MTDSTFADAEDVRIDIRRTGGVWYAHIPETALWGEGDSLDAAVAQLAEQRDRYRAFVAETGIAPLDVLQARPEPRRAWRETVRVAKIVAVIALCAIPLSYAISTGIERGAEEAAQTLRLRTLLSDLEQGILDLGRAENDLAPERVEALREAVARIVERLRPFTAPAGRLFEAPQSPTGSGDDGN